MMATFKMRRACSPCLSYLHDLYFLATAASMDGHSSWPKTRRTNLPTAWLPMCRGCRTAGVPHGATCVLVRFHRWDEILKLPAPDANLKTANTMWHFARGMALASTGKGVEAETEQVRIGDTGEHRPGEPFAMSANNKTHEILRSRLMCSLQNCRGRHEKSEAIAQLKDAVAIQDTLKYGEPPGWFYPVRESLGAALFRDGKISEAEQTFREDLQRNPRNPRSLFGLLQALRAARKISRCSVCAG